MQDPIYLRFKFPTCQLLQLDSTPKADWGTDVQENFSILCKAANLPASNIASIDVPFRGRTLKVAGDRTIDNWTVTIINDEDFGIRNAMEAWMNGIARLSNNTGATNPDSYMTDAYVYQLGRGYSGKRHSKKNSDTADDTKSQSFEVIQVHRHLPSFCCCNRSFL